MSREYFFHSGVASTLTTFAVEPQMNLKTIGKNFVGRTAQNPLAWSLYQKCGRISRSLGQVYGHAHFTRQMGERDERLNQLVRTLLPEPVVASGPFRGMRYACAQSFGSALLPKLIGSYESELHSSLEPMFRNPYSAIVDIGCAEGYYAVGLGMRFPQAKVYAFDVDEHARRFCADLAAMNGVSDRMHIGGFCDDTVLRNIPLGDRALIISDCEGYEGVLFTSEMAGFLANHDLMIETHDFLGTDVSSQVRNAFSSTHEIRSVKSIDDIEKAHTYRYDQLQGYDFPTRRLAFAERRPAIMEWLVISSRV